MRCCSTPPSRSHPIRAGRRAAPAAFTAVELIVLLAVATLLVGLLIPAVGASRARARVLDCASRAQQLGIAINLYMADYPGCLPQVLLESDAAGGERRVCPPLFGGKAGFLAEDAVDRFGIADRPLNRYVLAGTGSVASAPGEIEAFHSPADRGALLPGHGQVASMYQATGSSYVINARLLRSTAEEPPVGTLIPVQGGPMPKLHTPSRTWLLGAAPILNYDTGADRRMVWYGRGRVRANLLMADMHIAAGNAVEVAPGLVHTTSDYTFLP